MAGRQRWLLKLHGCVTHPDDIVLSREDYIRYEQGRAALAGIVQALLITRHMLFVGFSLTDDNFHRIADDVRRALRPADDKVGAAAPTEPSQPFGTALFLARDPLTEELWAGDLDCLNMLDLDGRDASRDERLQGARRLEIFLDLLLAEATTNVSHMLDPDYADILTGDEEALASILTAFEADVPAAARRGPAWAAIEALLHQLGLPPRIG